MAAQKGGRIAGQAGVTGSPTQQTDTMPTVGVIPTLGDVAAANPVANAGVLLDVTDIFGQIAGVKGNRRQRVVMDGAVLAQILTDPHKPLYRVRTASGETQFVPFNPGKYGRGAGAAGMQFSRDQRALLVAKLQHQMALAGLYGQDGVPLYGVWNPADQQALTTAVAFLQETGATAGTAHALPTKAAKKGRRPTPGAGGTSVMGLGQYLAKAAQMNSDATTAAMRLMNRGQVGNIQLTSETDTSSALDAQFRQLVGRAATAQEKAQFVAAFRADETRAQAAANAANQSSPQAAIAQENARYEAFMSGGSQASAAASTGGQTYVQAPSLASAAEKMAKESPDFMPYQVGQQGAEFLKILGYGQKVGIQSVQGG